mgnify:CR=1 FL=1
MQIVLAKVAVLLQVMSVMTKLGCRMTDEEWDLFIKIADQDHSGEVDFEEFKLVWGTGVNNTKPSIAWVGGIPKSDKSLVEREAEVKEAFERRARARSGAVPAPDDAPHDESIIGEIKGFGEVLDVVIWDERDVGVSWAKVKFKGVHAQALAMAVAGKEGAATIRGHELEVESWNQEKNNALAARMADLHVWQHLDSAHRDFGACTLHVSGISEEIL